MRLLSPKIFRLEPCFQIREVKREIRLYLLMVAFGTNDHFDIENRNQMSNMLG